MGSFGSPPNSYKNARKEDDVSGLLPSEVEFYYRQKKARWIELRNAKAVSDEICNMIGMPPAETVEFSGLKEAKRETGEALDKWGREHLEMQERGLIT